MNRSLYFIPLITNALRQTNPSQALVEAFRNIEALARDPEYATGLAMFSSFMTEVGEIWNLQSHLTGESAASVIEDISLQLFAETLARVPYEDGPETDLDDLPSYLRRELEERIKVLFPFETEPPYPILDINRDGKIIASKHLVSHEPFQIIRDIRPGNYTFELGSGRVLWAVSLTERDLVLTAAFPEKNISIAADTGEEQQVAPSHEMAVLNGELVFRIFPDLESGWLEIDTRQLR